MEGIVKIGETKTMTNTWTMTNTMTVQILYDSGARRRWGVFSSGSRPRGSCRYDMRLEINAGYSCFLIAVRRVFFS